MAAEPTTLGVALPMATRTAWTTERFGLGDLSCAVRVSKSARSSSTAPVLAPSRGPGRRCSASPSAALSRRTNTSMSRRSSGVSDAPGRDPRRPGGLQGGTPGVGRADDSHLDDSRAPLRVDLHEAGVVEVQQQSHVAVVGPLRDDGSGDSVESGITVVFGGRDRLDDGELLLRQLSHVRPPGWSPLRSTPSAAGTVRQRGGPSQGPRRPRCPRRSPVRTQHTTTHRPDTRTARRGRRPSPSTSRAFRRFRRCGGRAESRWSLRRSTRHLSRQTCAVGHAFRRSPVARRREPPKSEAPSVPPTVHVNVSAIHVGACDL